MSERWRGRKRQIDELVFRLSNNIPDCLKFLAKRNISFKPLSHLSVLAEVCITKDDEEEEIQLAKDLSKLELSGNETRDIQIVCRWFATRLENLDANHGGSICH